MAPRFARPWRNKNDVIARRGDDARNITAIMISTRSFDNVQGMGVMGERGWGVGDEIRVTGLISIVLKKKKNSYHDTARPSNAAVAIMLKSRKKKYNYILQVYGTGRGEGGLRTVITTPLIAADHAMSVRARESDPRAFRILLLLFLVDYRYYIRLFTTLYTRVGANICVRIVSDPLDLHIVIPEV